VRESIYKIMEDKTYLDNISKLNSISRLYDPEENIFRLVQETLLVGIEPYLLEEFDHAILSKTKDYVLNKYSNKNSNSS
jgi:hypothetical protein